VALDANVDLHLEPFAVVVWQGEVVQPLARAGSSCPNGVLRLDLAPVVQDHLVHGNSLRLAFDLEIEVGELLTRCLTYRRIQLPYILLAPVNEYYAGTARVYVRVAGAMTSWISSCRSEAVSTSVASPPMTTKISIEPGTSLRARVVSS
jgi:hypothetical protein